MSSFLHENAKEFYFPGNNTGVLLIHGFTGSPLEMRYLGDYLKEKGYTVKGMLLQGHGTSIRDMKSTNHFDWIRSAEEEYQELAGQCGEIFIVGLSMGGAIGLHLAQQHDVRGIVSLATPIRINSREYCKGYIFKHLKIIKEKPPLAIKYDKTPVKSILNLMQLIKIIKDSLHKVDKPILVMQSYRDETVHHSSANYIYSRVASTDKSIIFLHRSGHVITCDCEKEQVFEEVFNFISKRCKTNSEIMEV